MLCCLTAHLGKSKTTITTNERSAQLKMHVTSYENRIRNCSITLSKINVQEFISYLFLPLKEIAFNESIFINFTCMFTVVKNAGTLPWLYNIKAQVHGLIFL